MDIGHNLFLRHAEEFNINVEIPLHARYPVSEKVMCGTVTVSGFPLVIYSSEYFCIYASSIFIQHCIYGLK